MTDKAARYNALCHAMQSGVAMEMNLPYANSATEPKHLRVGANTALVQIASLARLLMQKGFITEDEYWDALIKGMEEEVARYEERLQQVMKSPTHIKLV